MPPMTARAAKTRLTYRVQHQLRCSVRRPPSSRPSRMMGWLNEAHFTVDEHRTLTSAESTLGAILLVRRQPDTK